MVATMLMLMLSLMQIHSLLISYGAHLLETHVDAGVQSEHL